MGDTRWHDIICRQENYTQLGWQECKPVAPVKEGGGGWSSIRLLDGGEAHLWMRSGRGQLQAPSLEEGSLSIRTQRDELHWELTILGTAQCSLLPAMQEVV